MRQKRGPSLYRRAKYVWEFPEYEEWADALDLIVEEEGYNTTTSSDNNWRLFLEGLPPKEESSGVLGPCLGYRGSGALIFWIRWFVSKQIKRLNLDKKYKRFVLTRSDHFYLCGHNLDNLMNSNSSHNNNNNNTVWVPQGEEYGGFTDRHLVAPAEPFLQAIDILPSILQNPKKYLDLKTTSPEKIIARRWSESGIQAKRFERMMFTVAVQGDATRWQPMVPDKTDIAVPTENHRFRRNRTRSVVLHLKYEQEYEISKQTCWGHNR
eukprot:Sro56_g032630.2  (266) ;mRNA; f:18291-19088